MKYVFVFLMSIHGLIHLMGFVKAFSYARINQLTKDISRPAGAVWLMVTLILITASIFYIFKKEYWWVIALTGVFLSQLLIVFYWHDAKFGTLVNVFILLIAVVAWAEWRFEKQYKEDVAEILTFTDPDSLLTLESIAHLPSPVQRYIIYSGSINKPTIKNFKITFTGRIRKDAQSEWLPFTTEQYNVIDSPMRLFFMKATMKRLPIAGYHIYRNGTASMDIRLLSFFSVQYQSGREMDVAETVTWLNDLCLFAPAALIDKRIQWKVMDSLSSKATFTHQDITVSATLYFNTKGELINFISDDRWQVKSSEDRKVVRFSTPAKNYREIDGRLVPSYGEAILNLPAGDLRYGQFHCTDIQFNVKTLE